MIGMSADARLLALLDLLRRWSYSTELSPISPAPTPVAPGPAAEKIQRVMDYILENLDGDVRQEDAAKLLRMSPASFSRFFRQHARNTFVGLVGELRIGEACRLLMETDAPITEIAFGVGYQNLSNFNEHFRRLRGMTPRDYRTMMVNMLTHPDESSGPREPAGTARPVRRVSRSSR